MYWYVLIYNCIQHVFVQQEFRWSKLFLLIHVHLRYEASPQSFSMCHAAVVSLFSTYL
jgi:hypothetical protein